MKTNSINSVCERMERIILFKELKRSAFADKVWGPNIGRQNLNDMLHRRDSYSEALLGHILRLYDDVSEQWIKEGKGCPFKCGNGTTQNGEQLIATLRKKIEDQQDLINDMARQIVKDSHSQSPLYISKFFDGNLGG